MRGVVLPLLMVIIGVALIVRTVAAGVQGVAVGLLLGVLFILAGAGRLYVERHR